MDTRSTMFSRPPVWLDPWQRGVARKNSAPVEEPLRSVPHEFDTRPVSMNLDYPAAIDGPEESDAVTMHQGAIATAAKKTQASHPNCAARSACFELGKLLQSSMNLARGFRIACTMAPRLTSRSSVSSRRGV